MVAGEIAVLKGKFLLNGMGLLGNEAERRRSSRYGGET
jgi:hypothetical protein